MARRPNLIPSVQLNVALPLGVYTQLTARLYSELEGRVPHGAYSRFIAETLLERMNGEALDLAPYSGSPSEIFIVFGSKESVAVLKKTLEGVRHE